MYAFLSCLIVLQIPYCTTEDYLMFDICHFQCVDTFFMPQLINFVSFGFLHWNQGLAFLTLEKIFWTFLAKAGRWLKELVKRLAHSSDLEFAISTFSFLPTLTFHSSMSWRLLSLLQQTLRTPSSAFRQVWLQQFFVRHLDLWTSLSGSSSCTLSVAAY